MRLKAVRFIGGACQQLQHLSFSDLNLLLLHLHVNVHASKQSV